MLNCKQKNYIVVLELSLVKMVKSLAVSKIKRKDKLNTKTYFSNFNHNLVCQQSEGLVSCVPLSL